MSNAAGQACLALLVLPLAISGCASGRRQLPPAPLGVNYMSRYHQYKLSDEELDKDFTRFSRDGVNIINLSLYWYRLEGPEKGKRHPEFIQDIRHVIDLANAHGLMVLVTMHTLWGEKDSEWCTPPFAVCRETGKNVGAAIYTEQDVKADFLATYEWMVSQVGQPPGLVGYCMLNEPWYWPHEDWKKESFVDLIRKQKGVHERLTPDALTLIRFVNHHTWNGTKNIFAEDWDYDRRIMNCLDVVGLNFYYREKRADANRGCLETNVKRLAQMGKRVLITEFGSPAADPAEKTDVYRKTLEAFRGVQPPLLGWMAWMWCSQDWSPSGNDTHNICDPKTGGPVGAYEYMISVPPVRR